MGIWTMERGGFVLGSKLGQSGTDEARDSLSYERVMIS